MRCLRPSDELTHQRGLAGARLAGDKDNRAPARQRGAEHPVESLELGLAGDKDRPLELVDQLSGLDERHGVEAFGEPVVYRPQQLECLAASALGLPQAGEQG